MDQAKSDLQSAVNNAKSKVEDQGRQTITDIKQIPPQVWGVGFGLVRSDSTLRHISRTDWELLLDNSKSPMKRIDFAIIIKTFVIVFLFHVICKRKEDPIITAGVFFFTLFAGALSIFLRNHTLEGQFQQMVVMLSVARVFFNISAVGLLVVAFLPFAVNTLAAELKARKIIP